MCHRNRWRESPKKEAVESKRVGAHPGGDATVGESEREERRGWKKEMTLRWSARTVLCRGETGEVCRGGGTVIGQATSQVSQQLSD